MRKYKIAVFDLDGTVLDQGCLSPVVRQALTDLHELGVEVVVATGRSRYMVPRCIRDLSFIRYIISANGASVLDRKENRLIWQSPIKTSLGTRVVRLTERYHGGANACFGDVAFHSHRLMKILRETDTPQVVENVYAEFSEATPLVAMLPGHMRRHKAPLEKMDCRFLREEDYQRFCRRISRYSALQFTSSGGRCAEVTAVGVDKISGVRALLEHLSVPMEELAAFGDSDNDVLLLREAGCAVVMGNGSKAALAEADMLVPRVQEDGAAVGIRQLFFSESN